MSQQYFIANFGTPRGEFIRRISVQRLFDEWTYDDLAPSDIYGLRLAILNGANGSGKTTLLNLVRAALSARPGRHKRLLYGITFASFEVELVSGLRFGFEREKTLIGGFNYYVQTRDEKLILPFNFNTPRPTRDIDDEEVELTPESPEEAATVAAFTKILDESAPYVVYLPTNREGGFRSSHGFSESAGWDSENDSLRAPINAFMRRLQIRARRESNDAEVAAFDVLARTIDIALAGEVAPPARDTLLAIFQDQMQRTTAYAAFGLTTKVSAESIIEKVQSASEPQFGMIAAMVRPYLESQRARLDSVKDTYELISQFIDSINQFIHPKTVTINLLDDLRILKGETRLPLRVLSSGERQLLRMFSSATALGPRGSLVLVDEPELSLNADWTRLLIRRLLAETLTEGTQFMLATHSIELLSQFEDAVLELKQ